jgi:hypothetical protein
MDMESVVVPSCSQSQRPSFADVCRGSNVLQHVFKYLSSQCLKTCRYINKEWELEARKALMDKCELDVDAWSSESISRIALFSSWKVRIHHARSEEFWTAVLQDRGREVISLHIVGLAPGWTNVVRRALTSSCPHLKEMRIGSGDERSCPPEFVELEAFCRSLDRTASVADFKTALDNTNMPIFQPFLPIESIETVTMEWQSDCYRMPAFLPIVVFVIISSCPRLKHLSLLDLEPSLMDNCLEDSRFGILMHLARHPAITRKLETLVWRMNNSHFHDMATGREEETQVVRFITANPNLPHIQFGSCLKSLHWDVMHCDRTGGLLLPGILHQAACSNLRTLRSDRIVLDSSTVMQLQTAPYNINARLRQRWISRSIWPVPLVPVNYPTLPNLVELEFSLDTCRSICLSNFIDAVPQLQKLRIFELQDTKSAHPVTDSVLTEMITPVDRVLLQHSQLRVLKFDIRLGCGAVVGNIATKFPHLQELCIGEPGGFGGNLDLSQRTLVDNLVGLRGLKRLHVRTSDYVNTVHLIDHTADILERVPWIEFYHLQFIPGSGIVGYLEYVRRKRELHAKIRQSCTGRTCQMKVSWSNRLLLGTLEMHRNSPEQEMLRQFINFVQQYRLPIELKCSEDKLESIV